MGVSGQGMRVDDLPSRIALFPLPRALLLPRADLPLNIFEPRYLQMVNDALAGGRIIGMVQPLDENADLGGTPALFKIGCAGRITAFAEAPDDRILITLSGLCRFEICEEIEVSTPYRQAKVLYRTFAHDLDAGHGEDTVDRSGLLTVLRDYLDANNLSADWDEVSQASNEMLVNTLSMLAPYEGRDKQA